MEASTDRPPLTPADIPEINMGRYMLQQMRKNGDLVALVDGNTDTRLTFTELVARTERVASGLQKLGVQKGDVVCIIAPNHTDYLVSFYAVALVTAVFQTVNPMYTVDDTKHVLRECQTKFLITLPALLPKVQQALTDYPDIKVIVFGEADGCTSFESLADPANTDYVTPECDVRTTTVALLSSSGTTGFPKAVKLSHYSIVTNMIQINWAQIYLPGDTLIVFLPLFHAYGLYIIGSTCHVAGSTMVIMSRFHPEEYMRLIQKHKPRTLQTVPPVMVMFSKHPKVGDYDLSSVENIVCGAAPLSEDIEKKVISMFRLKAVDQGYGMTEIGVTNLNTRTDFRHKSVGKLLPLVELKIVDVESGAALGTGREGEIWVKGPQVTLGYLNLPRETAETFLEDGWVRTGDIGYVDEDGYLFVVDRLKELIKYKAFQVAPATLEDILLRHKAVADVGVIGVPDEDAGELPRAFVVKKADVEVTEGELVTFVAERVSPHMKLRGGVEFVSEIPRSLSGKILRRHLRERLAKTAPESDQ